MKEQKKVKVLSLFDGMACGMIAMQLAGMSVEDYFAYEIDKYAVQTASHNFPSIKELGDVFEADYTQYKGIDYLIGGSPCQHWSIAQSPDRRETAPSGIGWDLFSQYVRALREAEPRYFIYENNKSMAKAIYKSISDTFGFEPIMINSALVSAQNRQRLYWVGRKNSDGTYSKVDVRQPEDRGIYLRDIVDGIPLRDKSLCIDANYFKGGNYSSPKKQSGLRICVAEPVGVAQRGRYNEIGTEQHIEARTDNKSNCLTTVQKDCLICQPIRCFTLPREDGLQTQSKQYRVYEVRGKSTTLCAEGGGMGAKTGLYAIPAELNNDIPISARSGADGKTYNVYKVENGSIVINNKTYPIKLPDGYYIIRKLTVAECKRLQTVPEWYEFPVSDTQAYRMLGNGWTCEVIAHLIRATCK